MVIPRVMAIRYKQEQDFAVAFEGESSKMVKVSDMVKPGTAIFEGERTEVLQSVNLCKELAVTSSKVKSMLLKSDGEIIEKGDVIARRRISMGIAERIVKSDFDGRFCLDRLDSGVVDVMSPFSHSTLVAGVSGRVKEVAPCDGLKREVIISVGGYVGKAFVITGESVSGKIHLIKNADSVYLPGDVNNKCKGKIVVAGRLLTIKLYDALVEAGANGVIVGGINYNDFKHVEKGELPVFISEGWGTIPVNSVLLELLTQEDGSPAYFDYNQGHLLVYPVQTVPDKKDQKCPDEVATVVKAGNEQQVQVWDFPYWGYCGSICNVLDDEGLLQVVLMSGKKILVKHCNVVVID